MAPSKELQPRLPRTHVAQLRRHVRQPANISTQDQVTDEDSRFCCCSGLGPSELYSASSFCKSYLVKFALAKGLVFMTAASTVLVNALLQMFMDKLATLPL